MYSLTAELCKKKDFRYFLCSCGKRTCPSPLSVGFTLSKKLYVQMAQQ